LRLKQSHYEYGRLTKKSNWLLWLLGQKELKNRISHEIKSLSQHLGIFGVQLKSNEDFEFSQSAATANAVESFLEAGAVAEGLLKHESLNFWRRLRGAEFEGEFCALFRLRRVDAKRTPAGPDGGVDVVFPLGGSVYLVQCKGWQAPVGVKVVRELAGVVASRGASSHRGVVTSTNGFTANALAFALKAKIKLWDARSLVEIAKKREVDGVKFPN